MKRLFYLAAILATTCSLHAQVVNTTVCDILKNPQSFNGKIVSVKGTVVAGFAQFVIQGKDCGQQVDAIWLAYPDGTKAKAGPAVMLQLQPASNFGGTVAAVHYAPVTLQRDKAFKEFDSRLAAAHKTDAICLGCNRYTVSATLVGRLDGVDRAGFTRDSKGKIVGISGFGNLNAYRARLVLQSVSDVSAQEVDYSKSAAAAKGESAVPSAGSNPQAGVNAAIKVYGAGNPLGEQLQRDADAFGKPGEQNGVIIDFKTANLENASLEQKGAESSPDGVLYNCLFDNDRLKNNAMSLAIAYAGALVADIRNPKDSISGHDVYTLDFHAWENAALCAIGLRMKTLTMPGDYILWNMGWEPTKRDGSLQTALTGYLANQALIHR